MNPRPLRRLLVPAACAWMAACAPPAPEPFGRLPVGVNGAVAAAAARPAGAGALLRLDPRFDALVPPDATVEKIADGFIFVEGPAWDTRRSRLLFSDIRGNAIHQWSAGAGARPLIAPFFEGPTEGRRTWGPNGLTFDAQGRLVVSDQGRRQVRRMEPDGTFTVLADRYQGARLNSPNDVVHASDGTLYFTDPPYGLDGMDESPLKELPFNGIYRVRPGGGLELIWRDQNRPNGLALSPDESTLYVANSDAREAVWVAYEIGRDGLTNPRVFFDATGMGEGVPDGMKVDRAGNLFATGPGGVLVIAPDRTHLGTIQIAEVPANVGWGDDGRTLYITARTGLYRIRLATQGRIP
jgi:gluconolactonase